MCLLNKLSSKGIKCKIISCSHLTELKSEYISILQKNNIDTKLYKRYISSLDFKIPEYLPEAQSIIAAAVPSYRSEAGFKFEGKDFRLTIPPTYRGYEDTGEKILNTVCALLKPAGYKALKTNLPQKLLAVHSGLAYYGKNNITYVEDMGSFYQLVSLYSDLPVETDHWHNLRMLERCNKCSACIKVCPAGAINNERFMINAERCITFFNENGYQFPEWINPEAHNSLIGCMLCQYNCPENKRVRKIVDNYTEVTEEETQQIINSFQLDELGSSLKIKLLSLDLIYTHTDFANLKRNLLTLLYKGNWNNNINK